MQYRSQAKCKICSNDDCGSRVDAYRRWGRWGNERVSHNFKDRQVVSGSYRAPAIHTAIAVGIDDAQGRILRPARKLNVHQPRIAKDEHPSIDGGGVEPMWSHGRRR